MWLAAFPRKRSVRQTEMSKRTNKAANTLLYMLESVVVACLFGIFSFYVIYRNIAGGVPLLAYVLNLIFIVGVLLLEKFLDSLMLSKSFAITPQTGPLKAAMEKALYLAHLVSFKTALYLYYLAILLVSRAATLEPTIISDHIRIYIHSVEYCVLLLIPFDKFLEQILKDEKRNKKIYAKLMFKKN